MASLALMTLPALPLAAVGYSILYLLFGRRVVGSHHHLHCRQDAGWL